MFCSPGGRLFNGSDKLYGRRAREGRCSEFVRFFLLVWLILCDIGYNRLGWRKLVTWNDGIFDKPVVLYCNGSKILNQKRLLSI